MLPIPRNEFTEAIIEKYFNREKWEQSYNLITSVVKSISRYSGLNFNEVLNLPYSYYLLLKKESWIDSWMQTEDGRNMLKDFWRFNQASADLNSIRKFTSRGGEQ